MRDLSPFDWSWVKAVAVSSAISLAAASLAIAGLGKLVSPARLGRLPNWLRWLLVLPAAFAAMVIAEYAGRAAFRAIEAVVNHRLLFRPGVDYVIWQLFEPVFFILGAVYLAPVRQAFVVFVLLDGLKIAVAISNLSSTLKFVKHADRPNVSPWTGAVEPITNAPLWWAATIDSVAILFLLFLGVMLCYAKISSDRDRARFDRALLDRARLRHTTGTGTEKTPAAVDDSVPEEGT